MSTSTQITGNTEVAVVLGSGFDKNGAPSQATVLRAQAAVELARTHHDMTFILSGAHREWDRSKVDITEAELMARVFESEGFSRERLLLEDDSRDTMGNAICSAALYLRHMQPGRLFVVTSPFHGTRALTCFRNVLGPAWDVRLAVSLVADTDEERGAREQGGIDWATRFFQGITPGDLPAIISKLLVEKPNYKTVEWLSALAAGSDGNVAA